MDFQSDKYSTSFSIPDRPTVRQQMSYVSTAGRAQNKEYVEKLWEAAKQIITSWKSELLPDITASLDTVDDPQITDMIIWAAFGVKNHVEGLESTPKN